MSRFRLDGKWVGAEEMRADTLRRQGVIAPQEATNEALKDETSETSPEVTKPTRKAIIAELEALGVEFKRNAKTEVLQELLTKNALKDETPESEQ